MNISLTSGSAHRVFIFFLFLLLLTLRAPWALALEYTAEGQFFTDRGQYNYAKFLFDDGDYNTSGREFSRLIASFPGSPYLPRAQFMTARAYFEGGKFNEALAEFRQFVRNYPTSPLAKEAKQLIAAATNKGAHLEAFATENPRYAQNTKPLKAVQVFYFNGKTKAEVDDEIEWLSQNGINTVIVRVFHNIGDRPIYPHMSKLKKSPKNRGLYYKSSQAELIEDILPQLIESAHRHGLDIYAWMTTRYANYGVENIKDLQCKGYNLKTGRFERCKGLDLFNEKAIKRLEGLYSDLAEYDIDGILFQDDLVLRHTEGFGSYASALFKKDTGRKLRPEGFYHNNPERPAVDYTEDFWTWAAWKNKRLLQVAKRIKTVVREKNPDVKFAINMMYEAVTNPGYGLAWLSQDMKEASNVGFDYYSIMAYHRQMADELHKNPEQIQEVIEGLVKEAVLMVGAPEKVLIKFQTIDWKTGRKLPHREVVNLLRAVKDIDNVSLAVAPYLPDFPVHEIASRSGNEDQTSQSAFNKQNVTYDGLKNEAGL